MYVFVTFIICVNVCTYVKIEHYLQGNVVLRSAFNAVNKQDP